MPGQGYLLQASISVLTLASCPALNIVLMFHVPVLRMPILLGLTLTWLRLVFSCPTGFATSATPCRESFTLFFYGCLRHSWYPGHRDLEKFALAFSRRELHYLSASTHRKTLTRGATTAKWGSILAPLSRLKPSNHHEKLLFFRRLLDFIS